MLVFPTTVNAAIMSLPVVAVLHRRMHRTLSAGPSGPNAERFAGSLLGCVLRCGRQAAANQGHQKPHTGAAMKTTGVPLIS